MYNSGIMLIRKWSLATAALWAVFALAPGLARAQAPSSDIPSRK